MKKPCLHCEKRTANASRGLCKSCFEIPEIVMWYPAKRGPVQPARVEPTDEQLDALIAKMRPTMPKGTEPHEPHGRRQPVSVILVRSYVMHARGRRVNRKKSRAA